MKAWERRFVTAGIALAGLVFLIAAVRPAWGGGSLNATFLLVGVALIVGAVVAWRRFARVTTTTGAAKQPQASSPPPESGPQ